MNELTIDPFSYQIGKLPAMTQFHVVRRIGPVLAAMGVSISAALQVGKDLRADADMMNIMATASDVMAKMSNDDAEYVIFACLAAVKRRQGDRWMQVVTGRQFQFQDIDMQLMLRLTVEVLKENLAGFFPQPADESSTSAG